MSEIQVTTTDLFSGSNTLNSAAVELGKVQVQLGAIIDSAGDAYEGQLRQALEDIIGPGIQRGGRLQNRAGELGRELYDRAGGFETANVAGQSATLKASAAYINYVESTPTLGFLSILKNKMNAYAQSIWNIAGLTLGTLGGWMSRFIIKNQSSTPPSFNSPLPPPKKYLNYAESVISDDKRRTWKEDPENQGVSDFGLYTRFDNSGGKSNCTWYAAAAIEKAHGIPLNSGIRGKSGAFSRSLGNGGQWADNAEDAMKNPNSDYKEYKPFIKDVNKIPEPGSVYSVSSQNHVAFVENVTMVENNGKKQLMVTVSEENYLHQGDGSFSGSERIELPNDPSIYRWRRELYFDLDPNTGEIIRETKSGISDGKFIHFADAN